MNYKIEEVKHEFEGRTYTDLRLTFENGKKWLLVPLTKKDTFASKAYFYALLEDRARH